MEKVCLGEDRSRLVHILLDIGEELLLSGAEISRVENTVARIGMAYGARKVNIFVITSCIILTLTDENGVDLTNTKRIEKPAGTDLTRIDKLNTLSRICCAEGMSLDELEQRFHQVCLVKSGYRKYIRTYVGHGIVGFAFAIFFGGQLPDGFMGVLGGLLLCQLQFSVEKYCPNHVVFNLISGFIIGSVICALARVFPVLHADKIMIGVIMLQIPGIAMTLSFRDVITGETISGTLRLIECLVWAIALACGYMLAIMFGL